MYEPPQTVVDLREHATARWSTLVEQALAEAKPGQAVALVLDEEPSGLGIQLLAHHPEGLLFVVAAADPPRWRVEVATRAALDTPLGLEELLGWDHERLLTGLAALPRLTGLPDDLALAGREFSDGLLHHADLEERVVYPAFTYHEHLRHGPLVQTLTDQHTVLRRLADRVVRATAGAPDEEPIADLTDHVRQTFMAHVEKEEVALLAVLDESLQPEQLRDLTAKLILHVEERTS